MTREEMLKEIEKLRAMGHTIGVTGSANEWRCQFDEHSGQGNDPVAAYLDAAAKVIKPAKAKKKRK